MEFFEFLDAEPFRLFFRMLPTALLNTIIITIGSVALGLSLGLGLALMRRSRRRLLSGFAKQLIDIGRSLPTLVLLLIVYFGYLALAKDLEAAPISPLQAAILAIGLKLGVYMAEVFRSGIQAVPGGLVEAGTAMGMSSRVVHLRVVLPVAVRIMLPAFGQYTVGALLDSSLGSIIAAPELTYRSRNIIDLWFSTELWIFVAAVYFLMAFPLSRFFVFLERRYALRY